VRLARVGVGTTLVVAAVAIVLAVFDLLVSALSLLARWSPALVCLAGLVILLLTAKPRSSAVVAVSLLLAVGLGLVATHQLARASFWWVCIAVALALCGLVIIFTGVAGSPARDQPPLPGHPLVLHSFREKVHTVPQDTAAIAITACFSDVALELPHVKKMDVEVDVTVFFCDINVRVPHDFSHEQVKLRRAFLLTGGKLITEAPEPAPPTPNKGNNFPLPKLSIVVVGAGGQVTLGVADALAENSPQTSVPQA